MRVLAILGILGGLAAAALAGEEWEGKAQFTAKVIDEEGKPLAGVDVLAGFTTDEQNLNGVTDTNGLFVATCRKADLGDAGFLAARKTSGFYETHANYRFNKVANGRWQPWDPVVTAVVRRIVNPIPMYAKKVHIVIPRLDDFVGFDLERGDWVAPYGSGVMSDVCFKMKKRYVDIRNFDSSLDVTVSNPLDGIQEASLASHGGSQFLLARFAPAEGYDNTAIHVSESSANYFKPNDDQSYYFRIRTSTNEVGMITSSQYGKIRSYIGFDVRREKTGTIAFTYYLNPNPNDQNLEFDPKRNLYQNLKSTERVNMP